jgi:hypothetical protein
MSSARKVKIKLKIKASKPRNPLVVHATRRKAGSHRKPQAALRREAKMALKKQLRED